MTSQETKFADEYVFLHFNGGDNAKTVNATAAARKAGYELPADVTAADRFCKGPLEKFGEYIDGQIASFTEKLSSVQRRNLWAAISEMKPGDPSSEFSGTLPLKVG